MNVTIPSKYPTEHDITTTKQTNADVQNAAYENQSRLESKLVNHRVDKQRMLQIKTVTWALNTTWPTFKAQLESSDNVSNLCRTWTLLPAGI